MRRRDLTGLRFGRLLVAKSAGHHKSGDSLWECMCDCGKVVNVVLYNLTAGITKSCGCLRIELNRVRSVKHGMARKNQLRTEYKRFQSAKSRCTNPRNPQFYNYGGRGIEFRLKSVTELIEDIGPLPCPKLTLDRINNDGHYEVGNLRWATLKQQANNKRTYRKHKKRRRSMIGRIIEAAAAAHEANRILCQALGDFSQPAWDDAPEWQKSSAISGARMIARNRDTTPEQFHEGWLAVKKAEGWKYGPVKNPETKEHPCFLPYNQLPKEQQFKDHMFGLVVRSVLGVQPLVEEASEQ